MDFSIVDPIIRVALTIGTGILFAIIVLTYSRIRNRKLLFISIGFGVFFLHSVISIAEMLLSIHIGETFEVSMHFLTLLFIVIGILKD